MKKLVEIYYKWSDMYWQNWPFSIIIVYKCIYYYYFDNDINFNKADELKIFLKDDDILILSNALPKGQTAGNGGTQSYRA